MGVILGDKEAFSGGNPFYSEPRPIDQEIRAFCAYRAGQPVCAAGNIYFSWQQTKSRIQEGSMSVSNQEGGPVIFRKGQRMPKRKAQTVSESAVPAAAPASEPEVAAPAAETSVPEAVVAEPPQTETPSPAAPVKPPVEQARQTATESTSDIPKPRKTKVQARKTARPTLKSAARTKAKPVTKSKKTATRKKAKK